MPRPGGVRVVNGRIAEVGAVKAATGDQVVDAHGLALAPGFIDPHNHSTEGLLTEPLAPNADLAGHHDVFVGQDGSSPCRSASISTRSAAIPRRSTC